ncbi:NADH oxidase [Streptomyces sp. NPDC004561]
MNPPRTEAIALRLHHLWSLREDVVVEWEEDGRTLALSGPPGTERVEDPAPAVAEALRRMELGPVLLANLVPRPDAQDRPPDTYAVLLPVLRRLSHMVIRTLGLEDLKGPVLSVVPERRNAGFSLVRLAPQRPVHLRPGVTIAVHGASFTVECRALEHRVVIHRPEAMWVVSLLGWPVTPDAMVEALPLPAELTLSILDYLTGAGVAVTVG